MRALSYLTCVLVMTSAAACASGSGSSSGAAGMPSAASASRQGPQSTVKKGNAGLITEQEIKAAANQRNVYELIEAIRPGMLRMRQGSIASETGNMQIRIYVDNQRFGETVESLRDLGTSGVVEIARLSGPDATMRWGTGHDGGAILITIRR